MVDKKYIGSLGFIEYGGVSLEVRSNESDLIFKKGDQWDHLMNNHLKTDNGLTVRERKIQEMHKALDAWIAGDYKFEGI